MKKEEKEQFESTFKAGIRNNKRFFLVRKIVSILIKAKQRKIKNISVNILESSCLRMQTGK